MKRIKLTLYILICFSLIAIVSSSCNESKARVDSFELVDIPPNQRYSNPGKFPFVRKEDNITLTIAVDHPSLIKDFSTNDFTKYIEEKANIKIKWLIWNSTESRNKFLSVMETGDYPDIFLGMSILNSDIEKYGVKDKKFIPINDLIETQTVRLKKVLEDNPDYVKNISSSDGKIYSIPSLEEYYPGVYGSKVWINKKWLQKLELDMPETTEEFFNTMIAFRDQDPNGNQVMDEIPFLFGKSQHSSLNFFLNSFLFTNYELSNYNILSLDNNKKIVADIIKPEYKDALKYLQSLYSEKLIYADSFNMTAAEVKNLFTISHNTVGAFAAENPISFLGYDGINNYEVLPPLSGPDGHISTGVFPDYPSTGSFVITDKCKEPIVAIKLADYLLTPEGTLNNQFGIKGKGWDNTSEMAEGIFGDAAIWTRIESSSTGQTNYKWLRGPYWLDTELFLKEAYPEETDTIRDKKDLTRMLYKVTRAFYEPYGEDFRKNVLPPVKFNSDESSNIQTIWDDLTQYISDKSIAFITGNSNVDEEWDTYLLKLNELKLNDYINIYQKAYDRQYR